MTAVLAAISADTGEHDDPDAADQPVVPFAEPDELGDEDATRAVVDASLRSPPVIADPNTALAVPETPRLPPLDMASLEKAGLVVGHKVRTRISEEFRITVGHILRTMHSNYSPGRGAPNVLMVTSARPGEGKSFSTLNLAGSIAQHTQREVLLVDVDAKQRSISAELGLADRPGLLDLSTNTSLRVEDVIVRTAIPHLSVITIGSGHTIGTEISPTRPVTTLVERIARRFPNAVVLLDAPPCLSTSDPSTLAPFVGQIVMVVEAERTQRNEVIAALDLIKACPSVTLMLNKIRLTTSYTFGAYHYFGTYS
jgi:receptor protein-tyrosine kinase